MKNFDKNIYRNIILKSLKKSKDFNKSYNKLNEIEFVFPEHETEFLSKISFLQNLLNQLCIIIGKPRKTIDVNNSLTSYIVDNLPIGEIFTDNIDLSRQSSKLNLYEKYSGFESYRDYCETIGVSMDPNIILGNYKLLLDFYEENIEYFENIDDIHNEEDLTYEDIQVCIKDKYKKYNHRYIKFEKGIIEFMMNFFDEDIQQTYNNIIYSLEN